MDRKFLPFKILDMPGIVWPHVFIKIVFYILRQVKILCCRVINKDAYLSGRNHAAVFHVEFVFMWKTFWDMSVFVICLPPIMVLPIHSLTMLF